MAFISFAVSGILLGLAWLAISGTLLALPFGFLMSKVLTGYRIDARGFGLEYPSSQGAEGGES